MKITLLIEGKTEKAFLPFVQTFLTTRGLGGSMPRLDPWPYHGQIPTHEKLRRTVNDALTRGKADAVIGLTDVYTGKHIFSDAGDAKKKLSEWASSKKFYPHAAQHDFEAWLLPYWSTIQRLAGHNQTAPVGSPESVNHSSPPSKRIAEIFERGRCRDSYVKPRDAKRILTDQDLGVAARACPELRAFPNRILELCGGEVLP